jgi:hypothetical protein
VRVAQWPTSTVPKSLTHLHKCGCEGVTMDLVFFAQHCIERIPAITLT